MFQINCSMINASIGWIRNNDYRETIHVINLVIVRITIRRRKRMMGGREGRIEGENMKTLKCSFLKKIEESELSAFSRTISYGYIKLNNYIFKLFTFCWQQLQLNLIILNKNNSGIWLTFLFPSFLFFFLSVHQTVYHNTFLERCLESCLPNVNAFCLVAKLYSHLFSFHPCSFSYM